MIQGKDSVSPDHLGTVPASLPGLPGAGCSDPGLLPGCTLQGESSCRSRSYVSPLGTAWHPTGEHQEYWFWGHAPNPPSGRDLTCGAAASTGGCTGPFLSPRPARASLSPSALFPAPTPAPNPTLKHCFLSHSLPLPLLLLSGHDQTSHPAFSRLALGREGTCPMFPCSAGVNLGLEQYRDTRMEVTQLRRAAAPQAPCQGL